MALVKIKGAVFLDGVTEIEPYLNADDMTDYSYEFLEEMTTQHEEIMYLQYLKNHEIWVNKGGDWENTKLMDPTKFVNQVKKKVIRAWLQDVSETDEPRREEDGEETSAAFQRRKKAWKEEMEELKEDAETGIPPAINLIFQFYWTQAFIEHEGDRPPRLVWFCKWFHKLRQESAKKEYNLELQRQSIYLDNENRRNRSHNKAVKRAAREEKRARNEAFQKWISRHRRERLEIYEEASHVIRIGFAKTYEMFDEWYDFFQTDERSEAKAMARDWATLFHPDKHRSAEFLPMQKWLHEKMAILNDFRARIP